MCMLRRKRDQAHHCGIVFIRKCGDLAVLPVKRKRVLRKIIGADAEKIRLLGQLKAGDKVKFEKVSIQAAQEALLNQRAALRTLRRSLDM